MSIIRMKYPFLDEIAKYAKEHLPEEACGLIAGSEDENGRLITKVYYLTNTDHAEPRFHNGSKGAAGSHKGHESKRP